MTPEAWRPIRVKMLTVCARGHVCSIEGSFVAELGSAIFGSAADFCEECDGSVIGDAPDPEDVSGVVFTVPICGHVTKDRVCGLYLRPIEDGWHIRHADITTRPARVWLNSAERKRARERLAELDRVVALLEVSEE